MPRQKKDAKILNIKLAKEISDQLEQFCEESGISKTVATEKTGIRILWLNSHSKLHSFA